MDITSLPSLRQLRVFERVAALQGIHRAAEAVSLSQPAVTQAVEKLEATLNAPLFNRRSRGTYLTESGAILQRRVRFMFSKLDEALVCLGIPERATTREGIKQRLTLQQIRAVFAVASSCSFADAARKIGVSTVSVHKAARDLEGILNKSIFQESSTGFVTTPAGAEFARQAWLALREIVWATEEIDALQGKMGGELRIGTMPMTGISLLGLVLSDIENSTHADIQVRTGGGVDLGKALRMGEIDFVVGLNREEQSGPEIVYEPLFSTPLVVVARRGHPLGDKDTVTIQDLERYRWVTPARNAVRRAAFDALFARMKARPAPVVEANALSMIRMLVGGSDRLTLLSRFEFEFERSAGNLITLAYPGLSFELSLAIAYRSDWSPTDLHRTFIDLVRRRSQEHMQ